jgi:hypothetical protein
LRITAAADIAARFPSSSALHDSEGVHSVAFLLRADRDGRIVFLEYWPQGSPTRRSRISREFPTEQEAREAFEGLADVNAKDWREQFRGWGAEIPYELDAEGVVLMATDRPEE